jgi:hypothetical protein
LRRLDDLYLQPDKPVDTEARLHAVTAYMADFLVDTGELDLTLGCMPWPSGDKQLPSGEEGHLLD